jgi:AraC family transcriptional regulator
MSPILPARHFFGAVRPRYGCPGIHACESRYQERSCLPVHQHANAHFCFVVDGDYAETVGPEVYHRSTGMVVFYPPGSEHAERHLRAGTHLLLEIEPPWLERAVQSRMEGVTALGPAGGLASLLARRVYEESGMRDAASALVIEGLVLEMLGLAIRAQAPTGGISPRWLRVVRDALHAGFREPPSLVELAAQAGVHLAHLTRAFRRQFGCSVGEYARRLRVDYACRRIAETDDPLSVIAADAGFADQSHLTRLVRRHTGHTPGVLRRQGR